MYPQVIQLDPATPAEARRAFDEVKHFATTDMGREGTHRWTYRVLKEPELTQELTRLSGARSVGRADTVSFQPCTAFDAESQDRAVVEEWLIEGRKWLFTAVLDGHLNHATVDFATHTLPSVVQGNLRSVLKVRAEPHPSVISRMLSDAITSVDNAIITDFLQIFPDGEIFVRSIDHATARRFINGPGTSEYRYTCASRVLGGSTVLLTLYEETSGQLWVANLGDSCAVLGRRQNGRWIGELINSIHNGEHAAERQRVQREHGDEAECVVDNRVVGWLQPTRAIGDAWLKLPAIYTEKVLIHVDAPWFNSESLARYIPRIKTPPYVSNQADVYYRQLRRGSVQDVFLITCSDGLVDLCNGDGGIERIAHRWAQTVGYTLENSSRCNLAMALLRSAIGGEDVNAVSRNLTVEMDERWMDDTTVIVQRFV
ncbi:hypothetical protein NM688_g2169 [Phlebia brevispora]|uniref:Uncharacterized protein n=1 Tax=Phlebia brevispora TaxID=194682 RepID=A0ACC1T981_9APHY|nr:hypothetical protein NM688_g2169 [Phlebia brevispora]